MSQFRRQRRQRHSRRALQQRRASAQVRLASLTVLRAQNGVNVSRYRQTWIQDVNDTFTRMFRENPRTTFADALHAYANLLEGNGERNRAVNVFQDTVQHLTLNGTFDNIISEILPNENTENEVVNTSSNEPAEPTPRRRSSLFCWL